MGKRIFFVTGVLMWLLLFQQARADELNLKIIRKELVVAIDNSKTTDSLYKSLNSIKDKNGLVSGFLGALLALKAKHSWNPYFKVKYLKDSEKIFKQAIAADPHNIEIRFMRFSIEHNVPSLLGFNKDLACDSREIISQIDKKNYGSADKDLLVAIMKFLIHSNRCTPAQNDDLAKHLVVFT